MNRLEYLLTCLSEECAELALAAAKSARFGLRNHHPDSTEANSESLTREASHVLAVMRSLHAEFGVKSWSESEAGGKRKRMEKWAALSVKLGTLSTEPVPGSAKASSEPMELLSTSEKGWYVIRRWDGVKHRHMTADGVWVSIHCRMGEAAARRLWRKKAGRAFIPSGVAS